MCGIFGLAAHKARIPDGLLERGTQSLAHRGPDDSGTIVLRVHSGEIGLGNRRLAILDPSPLGHQPMHDPDTGNWIVYNGEIYNFRKIREELAGSGATFVSHSDTEVLLKAYSRWGADCLARFRGMFAFALWDASQNQLVIARDPMGVKPLYYAEAGSFFLFASEVRSLLGTGLLRRRIDASGLAHYLSFGSSYDPVSLIEGVKALPPGHFLTWKDAAASICEYWDLVDASVNSGRSTFPGEQPCLTTEIQPMLEEAVRMQLVSDVPIGVFLSGGIDSSALVSVISRGGVTPSTFSIVFREGEFSEAQHSRAIAKTFRTDHHEIEVSQRDFLGAIPDALRAMDLPTMDGVNTFFVSREARKVGVKVALSGLGGDETFAGYASFRTVPRAERMARAMNRLPTLIRSTAASIFSALTPENDKNRKLAFLISPEGMHAHPYLVSRMLFLPNQSAELLRVSDDFTFDAVERIQQNALHRASHLDPINRVSYLESRCYMLNTLLRDSDCMSMSQGLELRVPLIDHELAKTLLALPGARKLDVTPKKLLVDAMEGSLPDQVVHRPKQGFTLPFAQWMRTDLRTEIDGVLNSSRIERGPLGNLLNGVEVKKVWSAFLQGQVSWSRPWSLFVLQRWSEQNL